MKNRITALLMAVMLLLSMATSVSAHTGVEMEREGSIEIVVRYDGKAVPGGTMTCIRVGYVHEDDGNYSFRRVMDDLPLTDIQSSTLAGELAEFVEKNKDKFDFEKVIRVVGQNGTVKFDDLGVGLYLIVQNTAADGYSVLKPFLVSLPYMEDGEYQYDVTAKIKSELEKVPETAPPTEPKDPTLPQTGQLNWPVPVMVVLGLGLFAAGWVLCFGRKKDGYEK